MNHIATHSIPAWRMKANFIIRADLAKYGMPGRLEQLWVRRLNDSVFEICCIPFFTYGLALGDKVETSADFTIQNIVEKGGHRTLRIAVANKEDQNQFHQSIHEWVENTGSLYEWYTSGYLAVDLPSDATGEVDTSALDEWIENGVIVLEIDE